MNEPTQKVDIAISEIKKILKVISSKDVSTNTTSALQLIESWLNHIQKYVTTIAKSIKSPESTDLARASALQQVPEQNPQKPGQVQEMTAMAASSAIGAAGGIDLGSDKVKVEEEEEDVEEDSVYLKEGTLPLRQIIREALSKMYNSDKKDLTQLFEELGMGEPPQVGAAPQQPEKVDTGKSLANELFPQVSSIVEKQYNLLKTSDAQRQAYTQQLLKALEIGFSKLEVQFNVAMAGGGSSIKTKTGDKSEEDSFNSAIDIPGIDPTGKSFAIQTYKAVFPKISTALNGEPPQFGLTDQSDRQSFVQTIVSKVQELCTSLEQHMSQANKPPAPAPSQAVQSQPPAKTNANSNFLMP